MRAIVAKLAKFLILQGGSKLLQLKRERRRTKVLDEEGGSRETERVYFNYDR